MSFEKEAASPYLNNVAPSKMKRLEGEQNMHWQAIATSNFFYFWESHLLKRKIGEKNREIRQKEVIFPTNAFFYFMVG